MEPNIIENSQQFCLRWHNYQTSLLSTLPQLLDGEDLTDVTLCAGGRNLKAHKVVLSACSHYFKQLFKEIGNCQHPVIVLPGVEFIDLCALVTFMYSGEVNIYQQQLASLLSMADTLHIRGLAEFTGDAQDYSTNKNINNNSNLINNNNTTKIKRQKLSPSSNNSNNTNINNECNKLSTPSTTNLENNWIVDQVQDLSRKNNNDINTLQTPSSNNDSIGCLQNVCNNVSTLNNNTNINNTENGQNSSPGLTIESTPTTTKTKCTSSSSGNSSSNSKLFATCFICGKQLSNQYNLRVHMETHQNAFYACASCSHVSRSRDALRKHVSYRHPHTNP